MDSKNTIKIFKRWLARVALKGCYFVINFLPLGSLYAFANIIAWLGFRIAGKQRRIAMEGLSIAFGQEKTEAERIKIANQCFVYMARSGIELIYMMDRPSLVKKRVLIEGSENLRKAFSKGNGVIAVSGHFGNFPLMLIRLSQEGIKTNAIIRYMRDQKIEEFFEKRRLKMGIHTIHSTPRNVCVNESITALRNNELLFIPLDQNFGTGGIFVDFFGKKAATATGPTVFALRTKAAILPLFIIRQKDDTHRIVIDSEISLEENKDYDKIIYDTTAKITATIERYTRLYPAEWGWIHRRWKTKEN